MRLWSGREASHGIKVCLWFFLLLLYRWRGKLYQAFGD